MSAAAERLEAERLLEVAHGSAPGEPTRLLAMHLVGVEGRMRHLRERVEALEARTTLLEKGRDTVDAHRALEILEDYLERAHEEIPPVDRDKLLAVLGFLARASENGAAP